MRLLTLRGTGPTASRLPAGLRAGPTSRQQWPESDWIYVPDRRVLREIVREHGYEFFPHLEGLHDFWFALDIDVRSLPLTLGKVVVRTALDILEERNAKYLLKFSGSNGFHVHWTFRPDDLPRGKWRFVRSIVRSLRDETERRLQAGERRKAFYAHIPASDPITELSAADKEAQRSVLFDELILKSQATIRAPFSLHMRRRLVAVPVDPKRLEAFAPERDAAPERVRSRRGVRFPENPVALFLKPPWT